jgi:hypothetical protein
MKDQANQKGKSRKTESAESKTPAAAGGKEPGAKIAPMTAKEKIAANQKNKRRK